jgi:hypothetical protein
VPHTLTTHFRKRNFDAASVTDVPAKTDALELPAVALPVLHRPKNTLTEEPVPFRLEGAIVDRFGFDYLTERPRANLLR